MLTVSGNCARGGAVEVHVFDMTDDDGDPVGGSGEFGGRRLLGVMWAEAGRGGDADG